MTTLKAYNLNTSGGSADCLNITRTTQGSKELLDVSVGQNFNLLASSNNLSNITIVNKFGRNPDIDTNTDPEDVWDGGGLYVPPTTARLHNITSTSTDDSSSGSGGRRVTVEGLDASYAEQSESIIMSGTDNVPTVNTYTRINRMYLTSAGSGEVNAGAITATAQVDGTVSSQISVLNGQTLQAFYTVPADKAAYLVRWYASMNAAGGGTGLVDISLRIRQLIATSTPSIRVKSFIGLSATGVSYFDMPFTIFPSFPEQTDVFVRVDSVSVNNADVSAGFDLILVDA